MAYLKGTTIDGKLTANSEVEIKGNLAINENVVVADTKTVTLGTSGVAVGINDLLDLVYPIGSIYTSTMIATTAKNPDSHGCIVGENLGGTWERIKDTFLYAADDISYIPGDVTKGQGGSKDAIVVSHDHGGAVVANGEHTHTMADTTWYWGQSTDGSGYICTEVPDNFQFNNRGNLFTGYEFGSGYSKLTRAKRTEKDRTVYGFQYNFGHNHATISAGGHVHTINPVGSSGANANMPPYLVVYVWKRTA